MDLPPVPKGRFRSSHQHQQEDDEGVDIDHHHHSHHQHSPPSQQQRVVGNEDDDDFMTNLRNKYQDSNNSNHHHNTGSSLAGMPSLQGGGRALPRQVSDHPELMEAPKVQEFYDAHRREEEEKKKKRKKKHKDVLEEQGIVEKGKHSSSSVARSRRAHHLFNKDDPMETLPLVLSLKELHVIMLRLVAAVWHRPATTFLMQGRLRHQSDPSQFQPIDENIQELEHVLPPLAHCVELATPTSADAFRQCAALFKDIVYGTTVHTPFGDTSILYAKGTLDTLGKWENFVVSFNGGVVRYETHFVAGGKRGNSAAASNTYGWVKHHIYDGNVSDSEPIYTEQRSASLIKLDLVGVWDPAKLFKSEYDLGSKWEVTEGNVIAVLELFLPLAKAEGLTVYEFCSAFKVELKCI